MQIKKADAVIMHDKRRSKKNGLYPIKLRVTFDREQKYYPTKIDLLSEDFARINNLDLKDKSLTTQRKKELKDIKLQMDAIHVRASQIIQNLSEFSFFLFEKTMFSKTVKVKDVYTLYSTIITTMNQNGNLGTASNYQCSRNSITMFKPKLEFREVTVDFLKGYEKWLLEKGKSISTVGIYLRPLRAVLNIAIEEGFYSKDYYPFGKRRYQIPAGKNTKKALKQEEVSRIFHYEAPQESWLQQAKDYWFFSYFANGMNMKDIALLKHDDIDGDYIRFIRAKTRGTSRTKLTQISIFLSEDLLKIINRRKTPGVQSYLFPIIKEGQNLYRQRSLITQFTKMVNNYISKIATEVGVTKHVTTYTARHSFATILKRKGLSTEMISESLGHSSLKTTSAYLDSFEDDSMKEISKILTFTVNNPLIS